MQEEEILDCKSIEDILFLLKSKVTKILNAGINIRVCIIELALQWEQFFTGQEKDLHDAIKVEFWKERIPTQIITKKATDAYGNMKYDNLGLGIYVAAGGRPWRLAKQFKNTVYIGIAFGQVINDKKRLIGIAEIFDEYGQSISMKCMSIKVEDLYYRFDEDKDFHLSCELMEQTISTLLNDYYESYQNWPSEVVIHKTSDYDENELNALEKYKEHPFLIRPIHIHSNGSYLWNFIKDGLPPTRGSYYCIEGSKALLYSCGVLNNQSKYLQPGMPYPLLIEDQANSGNMDVVCEQIMHLTKLNWNSTNTYEMEPITISHSRKIIKLLRAGLSENDIPTNIRYFI